MRIAKSIFVGSLAALVAAPALAKNSNGQKTEDKPASVSCKAYQLPPMDHGRHCPAARWAQRHRRRTPRADNARGKSDRPPYEV